ncbi:type III secretion system outer membrane ring subunit SctC [Serratia silvae]
MARDEGVKGVFDALSTVMRKPVILSKNAARKKVTGQFDFTMPADTLNDLTEQLGLIWYDDGNAVYVYETTEMRNAVVALRNTSFKVVHDFLMQSRLYDQRYPLRADSRNSTFYVSGPPMYVEVVTNAARFLDEKSDGYDGREMVAVIPLSNTFVADRRFKYRNDEIIIPGMATVIQELLGTSLGVGKVQKSLSEMDGSARKALEMPTFPGSKSMPPSLGATTLEDAVKQRSVQSGLNIVANPGNNSLLVRGSADQVAYVRNIVHEMDQPKRHVELSVWIVDLQKEALDQLGVQWNGYVNFGDKFGLSLNNSVSTTIDGATFMAAAKALSEKNKANIVSRPMILTQENIPAIFDNNRTFYSKLIGERSVELQNVTYGTLVSVLPRFTQSNEIEMMINVEDGNQDNKTKDTVDGLPEVGRTNISTVARVPRGKSLLIGGYTRDENTLSDGKIPGLGDLPFIGRLFRYKSERNANLIRVFLIQPKEIESPLEPDANIMIDKLKGNLASGELKDWMANYIDTQKWQ